MNIKKWAKNRTVRAIGWMAIVLLCLSFWAYVSGIRNTISLVLGLGALMLFIGVASLILNKFFSPQMKRIAGEIVFIGALWGGFAGAVITVLQRWIFKFPDRFTGKLLLSNSIIAAIFILWNRWEKKSEEPDD